MDASYRVMDRLGLFSPERIARQEAAEERDRKSFEENPGLWCAKHLGKHVAMAVLKPIGGDIVGEVASNVIHKIRK